MKKVLQILLDIIVTVALTWLIKLCFDLKEGTCIREFCWSFANKNSFPYGVVSGVFIGVIVYLIYQCLFKKRFYYRKIIKMLEKEKTNINTDDSTGVKVFSFFKDCLNKTIDSIAQGASYQLIHSNDSIPVDLAYEFSILNGTVDYAGNYCVDEGTLYRIRRNRVLGFNSKFIHRWNVLYATEFNLSKFIGDPSKWNDDEEYRKQLKTWKKGKKCQRYVFLTKNEIVTLMADQENLTRLNNYLTWHIANGWYIFLFITETEISSLKELWFVDDTRLDRFVDLLIVFPKFPIFGKIGFSGKVFVQDKQQHYKMVCDKTKVKSYQSWFERLPKQDDDENSFPVIINFNSSLEDIKLDRVLYRSELKNKEDTVRYNKEQEDIMKLKEFILQKIDNSVKTEKPENTAGS